jgi:broad specificity phosphatase PhoE
VQQLAHQHTTLVLIRHAEAAEHDCKGHLRLCGWLDVPLTQQGRVQAEHPRLISAQLGAVADLYTSSLNRAIETARPLADALGLKPRARRTLREISCGWLEGLPVSEVRTCYPDVWQANVAQTDETFRWPGGESYRGFRRRVLRSIRRLAGPLHGEHRRDCHTRRRSNPGCWVRLRESRPLAGMSSGLTALAWLSSAGRAIPASSFGSMTDDTSRS